MRELNRRTVLGGILVSLALMSHIAWAGEAAKVLAVTGTVYAQDASGTKRTLDRKASVNEGDTVITDDASTAQLRFIDGAVMGIKPQSQFKVDAYKVNAGDGAGTSNISVAKGGFWTLTGSIAKQNPEDYKVKTNYATIGVRGTAWDLHVGSAKEFMGVYQDCRDTSKTGLHIKAIKTGAVIDIGPDQEFSFASVDAKGNVQGLPGRPGELNGAGVQDGTAAGKAGAGGAKGAGFGADFGGAAGGGAGGAAGAAGGAGNVAGVNGGNIDLVFFNDAAGVNTTPFLNADEIARLTNVGVASARGFPNNNFTIAGLSTPFTATESGVGIDGLNANTTNRVVRGGDSPVASLVTFNFAGRVSTFGTWSPTQVSPVQIYTNRNYPQGFTPVLNNVYFATVQPLINPPITGQIIFSGNPVITIGEAYSGALTAQASQFTFNVTNGTITGAADWQFTTPSGVWMIDLPLVPMLTDRTFRITNFGTARLIDGAFANMAGSVEGVITGAGPGQRGLVITGYVFDENNPNRYLSVTQGFNCQAANCP